MTSGAWHSDPTGSHRSRWWDGERWTSIVEDDGRAVDEISSMPPPPGYRPGPGRRPTTRTIGSMAVAVLTVAALVVTAILVWPSDDATRGFADQFERRGDPVELTVGRDGGRFVVGDADHPLHGLRVEIPTGAVDTEVRLHVAAAELAADTTTGEVLARSEAAMAPLAAEVLDAANPDDLVHPLIGVLTAIEMVEMVGPAVVLEPAGTRFKLPISIELPASSLPPGTAPEDLIVLHAWDDLIQVLEPRSSPDGAVIVEVDHFSLLTWIAGAGTEAIRKNIRNAPAIVEFAAGRGPIHDAFVRLPGPDQFLDELIRGAACAEVDLRHPTAAETPGILETILHLGWPADEGADSLLKSPSREAQLWDRMTRHAHAIHEGRAEPWDLAAVFRHAIDIADGDAFQALNLAQTVIRDNRVSLEPRPTRAGNIPVNSVLLAPIRDDGIDEMGAYYHLLGTATFAYLTEIAAGQVLAARGLPIGDRRLAAWAVRQLPATAATFEEVWFASDSGDITGDPTEFAIDLVGIEVGRLLHDLAVGPSRDALRVVWGITDEDCRRTEAVWAEIPADRAGDADIPAPTAPPSPAPEPEPDPVPTGYYAVRLTDPNIVSVRTAASVDGGTLEMRHFRHGGLSDRSAPVSKMRDEPFDDRTEATRFICEQLKPDSFQSPRLAAGWQAELGGGWVTVDDWGSLDIDLCRSIVNG